MSLTALWKCRSVYTRLSSTAALFFRNSSKDSFQRGVRVDFELPRNRTVFLLQHCRDKISWLVSRPMMQMFDDVLRWELTVLFCPFMPSGVGVWL